MTSVRERRFWLVVWTIWWATLATIATIVALAFIL